MASSERARRQQLLLGATQTKSRLAPSSASSTAGVSNKRAAASLLRTPGIEEKTTALASEPGSNSTNASRSSRSVSTALESSKGGSSSNLLKRIADVVKRAQPHSIVQAYDKIQRGLQIDAQLLVNGEAIAPDAPRASSLQSGWENRDGQQADRAKVSAGFFDPSRGRFHYALGFRYSHSIDPALSLSTITNIAVTVTSASRGCTLAPVLEGPPATQGNPRSRKLTVAPEKTKLSVKSWRVVSETSARVGLALYELPVSAMARSVSASSSILALVWVAKLEVVAIFVHLHVCEVLTAILSTTLPRPSIVTPLQVRPHCQELGDELVNLRGFTMALTIRTLDRVIWEREWFQIDFPPPAQNTSCPNAKRVVSVSLLDESGAFRDRERFAKGVIDTDVAADAIMTTLESTVLVDFCIWEESACAPIWCITQAVRVLPASAPKTATLEGDFTLSASEKTHELLEAKAADRGNLVILHIVRSRSGDTERVVIKQIEVVMRIAFLNAALGTPY